MKQQKHRLNKPESLNRSVLTHIVVSYCRALQLKVYMRVFASVSIKIGIIQRRSPQRLCLLKFISFSNIAVANIFGK